LQRWQIILCAWKREITLPQILQFSASLLTILYLILIVSFYQCTKCKRDLPVDDFATDNQPFCRKRGFRRYRCRECVADYSAVIRERSRKLIQEAKDVPCMDCGVRWPSWIMEFDHRDPSKKDFEIGSEGRQFSKSFLLGSRWSNSMIQDGQRTPQSIHGTSFAS
jgi:DNA-directed RNA polymerase subunit RPC12/RpoP